VCVVDDESQNKLPSASMVWKPPVPDIYLHAGSNDVDRASTSKLDFYSTSNIHSDQLIGDIGDSWSLQILAD